MSLNRLMIGFTSLILGTGTAIAQDMPALVLDTAPGVPIPVPIPVSVHVWAVLAVVVSWIAILLVVGAIGGRRDDDAE
jgi:hypothetical protein